MHNYAQPQQESSLWPNLASAGAPARPGGLDKDDDKIRFTAERYVYQIGFLPQTAFFDEMVKAFLFYHVSPHVGFLATLGSSPLGNIFLGYS